MNQKITLPKAARQMADASGLTIRQCEDFLKGLTDIIAEALSEGESIKIKGIGTFRVVRVEARKSVDVSSGEPTEIAEHSKVVFVPCKELAAEINSPFEFFEAVELEDSISEEDLDEVDSFEESLAPEEIPDSEGDRSESDTEYNSEPQPQNEPEESIEREEGDVEGGNEELSDSVETEIEEIGTAQTTGEVEDHSNYRYEAEVKPEKRHRFGWGFIAGFAACLVAVAIGMGVGFMMLFGKFGGFEKEKDTSAPETLTVVVEEPHGMVADQSRVNEEEGTDQSKTASRENNVSGNDVPTSSSDVSASGPVYDTISKTRYLTTMAKEHYGDFNLWPYIYEENKAILGHPDRIRPGTRVIIPPLSKYGVTGSASDIAKAKQLGAEIYSRYR